MSSWRPRSLVVAVALVLTVTLAGVTAGSATAAPGSHPPQLGFALRVGGFGQEVLVTNAHDGSGRLFVVDKVGRVISFIPGSTGGRVYLDLRSKVNSTGTEQGMLGLAFAPNFKTNPVFWISYTVANGSLVISRFQATSAAALTVSPATEQTVLVVSHAIYTNHNGGMLAFDRTGMLLIGTGDGGGAGDPFRQAQSGRYLAGKILRIDVSRGCAPHPLYCVPPDNPLVSFPQFRGEVYDVGLRNPWRFSVDPANGNLWIADVGQDRYEEVDEALQGQKGLNFGWACYEGFAIYNATRCGAGVHYIAPLVVIAHPTAQAIIGGLVYRGTKYAAVMGPRYIFGDYITGTIWTMPAIAGGRPTVAGNLPQVTSIGADESGEVWATSLNGGLYQMSAR
jgi:glucose/arabinose dehydrogenase